MASKRFVARFGLDNAGNSITNIGVAGSSLTQAGAFGLTLTTTAASNVTLPTTGTLSTLAGTETLANKTLSTPVINGASLSGTLSGDVTFSGQTSFTNATAPIITAKLGPSTAQQHVLPAVTSDTIVLLSAAQALTNKTVNGITLTSNASGFSVAGGSTSKTLTVNNSLSFSGTDGTTMTFPTTSASIARTDAAQTFTGTQTFGAITATGTLSFDTGTNNQSHTTTGAGTITITSGSTGNINNMNIGGTTRGSGAFTTLTANGVTTLTAGTASTSTTTGTLVVTGGVGVSGTVNVGGDIVVTGNLTVNGTTTSVNSTVTTIKDPIITLGGNNAGADATADDNKDRGIEFKWFDTAARTGFFGFDDSTGKFTFIPTATNSSEVFSGTVGSFDLTGTTLYTLNGTSGTAAVVGENAVTITGDGITAAVSKAGNTVTAAFVNTDKGSAQNIFKNIAVSGQSTVVADTNNDTLTLVAGTGITITTDASTDAITITSNSVEQNTYASITDGTTTATASTATDTIKFRAVGTGLSVTVGSNDATHGDNVLYTISSTPNADATSLVARDAAGESAFRGVKLNTASATTAAHLDATTATFATSGAQVIATYSGSTYKAAKVIIRAGQGTNFQVTELLVVNDGSATPAVNHVEYGFIEVGTPFSVTYNAVGATGNVVNITADAGATSTSYTVEMVELV